MLPPTAIIALAGNIGAGKTTAGRNLAAACTEAGQPAHFYEEVLPDYVCSLLAKSNDDPLRWMELFQTVMVMRAVHREQSVALSKTNNGISFVERPLEESWVFGKANLAIGRITPIYYDELYAKLHAEHSTTLHYDLIVFLYVTEETAAHRRGIRARLAEDRYGDAYTQALSDAYFAWVLQCCAEGRMLVIDWNTYQSTTQLLSTISKALLNITALRSTPIPSPALSQPDTLCELAKAHVQILAQQ